MDTLNAKINKRYLLSCYRQGFGNYFCDIEVLKVVKKGQIANYVKSHYEYSIKYRKHTSAYDDQQYKWWKLFTLKRNPNAVYDPPKQDVWVHHETITTWNRRVRDI